MAPPKTTTATTVVSNNQINNNVVKQQQQQQQQPQQQVKPRKRKATGRQNNNNNNNNIIKTQVNSQPIVPKVQETTSILTPKPGLQINSQQSAVIQTTEELLGKKQQVPKSTEVKEVKLEKTVPPTNCIGKQISTEETDDIDAGIELDGSSNSGSSVKDMTEDQLKSASASPVMAPQTNSPTTESLHSKQEVVEPVSAKKTTSKQQLAANQEVIDADEQLLQRKLQKKVAAAAAATNTNTTTTTISETSEKKPAVEVKTAPPAPLKRRFSSQSSTECASGTNDNQSMCKICNLHVYQMERMLAEKAVYHKRCFRCHQCKIQLRVDSYSSHEGQVYCKTHHRQLFQPQVKLDNEQDVDIVAKSTIAKQTVVDDYLLHRGRLSELSFSFLQPKTSEGARQRQMIICENEPKELPKDVVRSDTKLDDGIEQLNLNLGNILEKFERGQTSNESSPPNSAGIMIEKPSINIRQTLKAFESRLSEDGPSNGEKSTTNVERPIIRKLVNVNEMFLKRNNSEDDEQADKANNNNNRSSEAKGSVMRRGGSLMMKLKKFEQRIAGEQVEDENEDDEDDNQIQDGERIEKQNELEMLNKLTSINLSSLKSQWEKGDIKNKSYDDEGDVDNKQNLSSSSLSRPNKATSAAALEIAALRKQNKSSTGDINNEVLEDTTSDVVGSNHQSVLEKEEELCRIRQQLARKKIGGDSVRNIYENAIKEAQEQTTNSINKSRRDSSDFNALNGIIKTNEIQQQLLKQVKTSYVSNDNIQVHGNSNSNNNNNNNIDDNQPKTPTTPKDHFQLNLSNRANRLKEKFELGLINNSSRDDSDADSDEDNGGGPQMSRLEQIRQEKMEDLSVFTDGEIKAREARSLFQQIDRKISAANGGQQQVKPVANSRSLASIGSSMSAKLISNQTNGNSIEQQQPIRLINNVKT